MPDAATTPYFLARRPSLLRRLARIVGCAAAAEDLAHDAWLKTHVARDVIHPAAFLERVALNLARDHRRSSAVRGPASPELLDSLVCPEPDAERRLLDRDRLRRAEAAIAALPPRRRRVFLAARLERLSHAQIAQQFGITPAAVEKHIARALVSLAAAMDEAD
jgi:RNA polymerase sigma-70 factor (ECF subfamily)